MALKLKRKPISVALGAITASMLAVMAFAVPLLTFGDVADATEREAGIARTEARHASSIPPLKLQLVSLSEDPGQAVFAWRTIFGVRFGTTRVTGTATSSTWNYSPAIGTWAAFGVAEAGLLGIAIRLALAA